MNELHLILKKIWFETIFKRYEYREIKPYYQKKFCEHFDSSITCRRSLCAYCPCFKSKKFETVIFHNGYTKQIRSFNRLKNYEVEIGKIDPIDWDRHKKNFIKDGYQQGKYYFCIDLTI